MFNAIKQVQKKEKNMGTTQNDISMCITSKIPRFNLVKLSGSLKGVSLHPWFDSISSCNFHLEGRETKNEDVFVCIMSSISTKT